MQKQFPTKEEAEIYAQHARVARDNEGAAAFSVPLEVRVEAAKCIQMLGPCGVTLTEAVRYYLEHCANYRSAPPVAEIVAQLVNDVQSAGRRERTVRSLRDFLGRFAREFGDQRLHDLKIEDLQSFCCPQTLAPRTRFNNLRMASQLYNYAILHRWAESNLVKVIARPTKESKEPGILTVAEMEQLLLRAHEFDLLAYVALGGFAGIRTAELRRLNWSGVKLEQRVILIGSSIAKTRSRRVIPVNDTLVAWLDVCAKKQGPIVDPRAFSKRFAQLKRTAGIERWPQNALRHSFASYHLARYENSTQTAYYMGHVGNSEMLHAHYKGLVLPAEAEKFWALRPSLPRVLRHEESVAMDPAAGK